MNITTSPASDRYVIADSPLGEIVLAHNAAGISAVDLATDGFVERFATTFGRRLDPGPLPPAWEPLVAHALEQGTPGELPLDLDRCSPFQRKVLAATAQIPRGKTRSYAWLAETIGRPRAFRAVGTALATNPVPLIIPCHRVVTSGGAAGSYSLGGRANKTALLALETITSAAF